MDAFAILIRFWNYVAGNHALLPVIRIEDADIIADFCWFAGKPDELLIALQDAGFVAPDYSVHDWFTHQPLAEKIARDREYSREKSSAFGISAPKNAAKQREGKSTTNPPTFARPNGSIATGSEIIAELMSGFGGPFEESSDAAEICSEFCNRYGYQDMKQRDALTNRIATCGGLYGLDCVRRMIGEIREDSSVREPIAVLHHKLNQAIGKR